jgi:hypothetical protein
LRGGLELPRRAACAAVSLEFHFQETLMSKTMFGAAALAMTMVLAAAPLQASARDRFPQMATAADTDKDGMISKDEYLAMAAKRWDDAMAGMMKMSPAKQAKMMKDDKMTMAGFEYFWRQAGGGR